MAGVTSTGFEVKTNDEILTELTNRANLPEYFGEIFPTTPDSNYGILSGVISASLKNQYDVSKAVASQGNLDEASGKYLDDLAALSQTYRLDSAPSTGTLIVTGNDNTTIPVASAAKFTVSGEVVLCSEDTLLTRSKCYKILVTVPDAIVGKSYVIRINGIQCTVTGSGSPTVQTIRDSLVSEISNNISGVTPTVNSSNSFIVTHTTYSSGLTLNTISNLTLSKVTGIVKYEASRDGYIDFFANSTVVQVGSITGVTSIQNIVDWSVGREVETDEDLRVRITNKPSIIGVATKPAIESNVSNLEGVIATLLKENITINIDAEGRPAKSYELYVEGGSDDIIAEEVWRSKPAGIETYGTVSKIIIDQNGDEQGVKFSRFETKYAWVKVFYQLDSEGVFPINGNELIINTVTDTGNSFKRGQDLESTRFYGELYNNVDGIVVTNVETAITDSPTDTPVYNSNRKSVSDTVKLVFDYPRSSAVLQ